MKRKLSTMPPQRLLSIFVYVAALYPMSPSAQETINVITFMQTVASVCGGSAGEEISTVGDNISLRTAEVTIDPGNGSLKIERDGVLIAEQGGELSQSYYECVENLTEALGGAFASPSPQDPIDKIGYPEPTRDEMLQAHTEQVALATLFIKIDRFEKEGCRPSSNAGYDCSYLIRSGGFGSPSFVTNTFAKAGNRWIMYWQNN